MIFNEVELLETRSRLLEELAAFSFEEFNWKSSQDSWSIAQVCHHLFLVESVFADVIAYNLNRIKDSKPEPKNIANILDRTKKIVAPAIVIPESEPFEFQQIFDLLTQSRAKLQKILRELEDPTILLERSAKHPLYGQLPLNQWIDLIFLHEHRHIEQIKEIKNQIRNH